ncbi:MAG: cytochrome c [Gammaproteobacteria bacterium]|nr:cytochrome c [Gammaproteobacteria bacterium]
MKRLILILAVQVVFAASAVAGGNVAAGKEKSQTCVACHGDAGMSAVATFPNIAGQYEDYLYVALTDYKSGERNNAIMSGIVAALNDQDMKDLAAYYASLEGLGNLGLPSK